MKLYLLYKILTAIKDNNIKYLKILIQKLAPVIYNNFEEINGILRNILSSEKYNELIESIRAKQSPFDIFINENDVKTIELLLKLRLDPNQINGNGYAPIHSAAWRVDGIDQIKLFIDNGSLVNIKSDNIFEGTPLHFASMNSNGYEISKYLIRNGANANIKDGSGQTALHHASGNPNGIDIARFLILNGAKVNLKDKNLKTPIHHAAYNDLETVKLLIKNNANINVRDIENKTALHTAARNSNGLEIVKLLLDCGIDRYTKDKYNHSALFDAATNKNSDIIEYLMKKDLSVFENIKEWSLLHHAAANDNSSKVVEILLNLGIDINLHHKQYGSALHWAIKNKSGKNITLLLINKGINLNFKDGDGLTALQLAIGYKRELEVIKLIVNRGADINSKSNSFHTALNYARGANDSTLIEFLEKSGAVEQNMEIPYIDSYSIERGPFNN